LGVCPASRHGNAIRAAGGHARRRAGRAHAFFGAANCDTAIDTELNRIVQTQAARIVSNSFGFGTPQSAAGGTCPGSAAFPIGGTSLSCPVFAAIQALASQGRATPIGFANPALYTMPQRAFHDVRPSDAPARPLVMITDLGKTLITMATSTSLSGAPGFDDTPGLGTPRGRTFLREEHRR
jgi:hypothetical protein